MNKTLKTPGERLEALLQELGYNDVQVADKLGITSVSVGRWRNLKSLSERNKRSMFKLATRLNINLDWLENGKGTPLIKEQSLLSNSKEVDQQITKNLKKKLNEQKDEIKLLKLKNERLDEILFLNAKLIDQLRTENQRLEKTIEKIEKEKE